MSPRFGFSPGTRISSIFFKKQIVPFRKFAKGVGRKAQVKDNGGTDGRGRWREGDLMEKVAPVAGSAAWPAWPGW